MTPLSADHLRQLLSTLPGWSGDTAGLRREYRFADFPTALAFMQDCVEPIEAINHHPEWTNLYDRVTIRLTTHAAGNRVTAKDVELAKTLEWVAQRFADPLGSR